MPTNNPPTGIPTPQISSSDRHDRPLRQRSPWHRPCWGIATSLCAVTLGAWLVCSPTAIAQEVIPPAELSVRYSLSSVLDDLAGANVVYLGETHDRQADHEAQLEIIQELYARNPDLAIGLEMFQRPFQGALNRYLTGEINETELRRQSQYDERWGFPWEYYAPILRFAREHQLPLIALNTPTEVTRTVAFKGLEGLTESDRQWIPPIAEINTSNVAYRQLLRPIYDEFHQYEATIDGFERFFLAQVLWDETMADSVVDFLADYPTYQVVVLAGQGHVAFGYGIPDRVARRMGDRPFRQRLVLLNPSPEFQPAGSTVAHYFWISPLEE